MKKYYEWVGEDVPVEFSGTAEEVEAFEAENAQLTRVLKARHDVLAARTEGARKRRKRLKRYSLGKQLKTIWSALEFMRDTGTEFPSNVAEMMDKLNQEES